MYPMSKLAQQEFDAFRCSFEEPYCFEYTFTGNSDRNMYRPGFTKKLTPEFNQFLHSNSDMICWPVLRGMKPHFSGHVPADAERFPELDWSDYTFANMKESGIFFCVCTAEEPCDYHMTLGKD